VTEQTAPGEWLREGEYEGAQYRFDRAGNLIYRRDPRGELHLRWDANQRLIESRINDSTTFYRYDPLGRRIEKRTGNHATSFAWDGDALVGDLIKTVVESESSDNVTAREWVYYPETFEPLAMLGGRAGPNTLLHYHNDPNGCPIRLTDSAGEVQWAASYTAWGQIARFDVDYADNPIRLQGQYEDLETGLYYNRHRFYDPNAGAFVSMDPLSIDAGDNIYEYANSMTVWIDPLGLKKCNIKKTAKKALGSAPAGMLNPHMHHIVMEGAFTNWSKKNRSLVTQARSLLRKHNISLQGKQNVVWAQNSGHSVEYARKVLAELKKADPKGRQAVADALEDIGKKLGAGSF